MTVVPKRFFAAAFAGLALCGSAFAEPTPEAPSSRQEVAAALRKIGKRYGRDAVKLESHLLNFALQAGSVLETSIRIRGTDRHEGRTYMSVSLETGIVYNSSNLRAVDCPSRIWSDIVDPTLRQFETIEMRSDGFALHISYQYGEYADRDDLNRRLSEHALSTDVVSFRLLSSDVLDMVHGRISAADLVSRSSADLNGQPIAIALPDAKPPPTLGVGVFPTPQQ